MKNHSITRKNFNDKTKSLANKLYNETGNMFKKNINPKGLISLIGTGLIVGTLTGCAGVQTNTIKINPGIYQSTLRNYSTDEVEINGKYYLGLPLPKNKTGEITGRNGNKLIPSRNLLLNYYLIPFSDSETIRKKGEVSISSKETYILINPDYCVPNHNLILPTKNKTEATKREIIFYSYSRNIDETQRRERGSHVARREIKTLNEKIPEVTLGNGENKKEFLYIKQKKEKKSTYNVHPNIINGNSANSPKNIKRLPIAFLDNASEFYTITRRSKGRQITEERIKGKTYVPVRAKIIYIDKNESTSSGAEFTN